MCVERRDRLQPVWLTPAPGAPHLARRSASSWGGDEVSTEQQSNYSERAEVSVLGGMLIDPDAPARAMVVVDESMFYRAAHRKIFRAVAQLAESDTAIDVITLGEELKKTGELEGAGGLPYLAELLDAVPTADNIEHHAEIVREHAERRRLEAFGKRLVLDARDAERSPAEIFATAAEQLREVALGAGPASAHFPIGRSATLRIWASANRKWLFSSL